MGDANLDAMKWNDLKFVNLNAQIKLLDMWKASNIEKYPITLKKLRYVNYE